MPGTGFNGFWGPNGQGKTNLLEALYVCLKGKSFRPYASREDWVPEADGEHSTEILVSLEDEQKYPYECRVFHDAEGRWEYFFNDKKCRASHIKERIPVVVFSPDDHAIIRRGPETRRNFLDDMLTDVVPGYGEVLSRFEKTLRNRNEVLKREGAGSRDELRVWTELFCAAARDLATLRQEIWPTFERRFSETVDKLTRTDPLPIALKYLPDCPAMDFSVQLEASSARDLASGHTNRGPHRDDFAIELPGGGDSRAKASQGQARLLALALKWTHADWVATDRGELPLFFIDDFSSELDAMRRKQLLEFIKHQSGQLFITGTERSLIDLEAFSEYTHYTVKMGIFTPS